MENFETRKSWMSLLAKAPAERLAALWANCDAPEYDVLRPPEIGGVMVRGRAGGTGAPFNLGEMTVTRCSLALRDGGTIGHGYVQGRAPEKATQAALIDALMQTEAAEGLRTTLLRPLAEDMAKAKQERANKAAATKVDFFTMVRGED